MTLKILIVFATSGEADILKRMPALFPDADHFRIGKTDIGLLITGVGGISTAWAMKKWLSINPKPDLALNAGIAGSFSGEIKIGEVVIPLTDCFADMGIESGDRYQTLAEAGLLDQNEFPFKNGFIEADNKYIDQAVKIMKKVRAITVNTSTGSLTTIERVRNKFKPDIETMEGATFFYICAMEKIPFLAIRAISNKIEPRNTNRWNIPYALENLAVKLEEFLLMIE
jgi:futalosine hydrolase